VFLIVWVGSLVALVAAAVLGLDATSGSQQALLLVARALYVLGVQAPTVAINVPLNNRLQALAVDGLAVTDSAAARAGFERRWNRSNQLRTVVSCSVVLLLLLVAF
jgi:uncharacterized membrane protein